MHEIGGGYGGGGEGGAGGDGGRGGDRGGGDGGGGEGASNGKMSSDVVVVLWSNDINFVIFASPRSIFTASCADVKLIIMIDTSN